MFCSDFTGIVSGNEIKKVFADNFVRLIAEGVEPRLADLEKNSVMIHRMQNRRSFLEELL